MSSVLFESSHDNTCNQRMKSSARFPLGTWFLSALLFPLLAASVSGAEAANSRLLWQIGQFDTNNAEFALAPNHYEAFEEDGLFIVGRSDSKTAWPYVHPGPEDAWAGQREHTFTVLFGVNQPVAEGNCQLLMDLIDTHKFKPVTLNLEVNGRQFEQQLPLGGDNDSIAGHSAKGRPLHFVSAFHYA